MEKMIVRPKPEIVFEMPVPFWRRIRLVLRGLHNGITFMRQAFRRDPAPCRLSDLSAFDRMIALNINAAGKTRTITGDQ
jgi:hypothetical protein